MSHETVFGCPLQQSEMEFLAMLFRVHLLVWMVVVLLSCGGGRGSDMYLHREIDASCASRYPCRVRLADVVSGDWERVVFVSPAASASEIETKLGFGPIPANDLEDRVFFVRGSKIVRADVHRATFGREGGVVFLTYSEFKGGWVAYSRAEATFNVTGGKGLLELTPERQGEETRQ